MVDTHVVTAVALSSSFISSITTIAVKKLVSPESRNELARIGNEFAEQLLKEARSEREELRATISELEGVLVANHETITKLRHIDFQDLNTEPNKACLLPLSELPKYVHNYASKNTSLAAKN